MKELLMTKILDKEVYQSNELITFKITIINNSNETIDNLFFYDNLISYIMPLSNNKYKVTTTSGIVTSDTSDININEISVKAKSSELITITGKIR
jgi:uncharacterized repeat protein (TIGR01451 family)